MENPALKDPHHTAFLTAQVPKRITAITAILGISYFLIISLLFPAGNRWLFYILIGTEVFHIWMAANFWWTIWETDFPTPNNLKQPRVDVFITVCGEPAEIVRETAKAALNMDYPRFHVYLLNDGFVANKPNWQDIERVARELGIYCITRATPGGAKAGNINHALSITHSPFVAVFDADHIPHEDFLKKTMAKVYNPRVGFVQTPQYYRNHSLNLITQAAWEQQVLFFGPVCRGKNRLNSVFLCGTNMLMRRKALLQAGGMAEDSIAEDFLTSVRIHQHGWQSVYVPEVLAEGLAPEDLRSYCLQQFRWARGSLDVIFRHNPLFIRGLSFKQRMQYLSSAGYWVNGLIVLLNALFPIIFFFFAQAPFVASGLLLAAVFLPYIFMTFYLLSLSTGFTMSAPAIAFSIGSFTIQLQALFSAMLGTKKKFLVTPKQGTKQAFLSLAAIHLTYIFLVIVGIGWALRREGMSASLASNIAWAGLNAIIFTYFVLASLPQPSWELETKQVESPKLTA